MHDASEGRSRESTGAVASNLDLYQVNGTYFEALGSDDAAQIISRLIQVFSPGIPQIYYAGLLAAPNDMALLRRTGVGRDINRPYHSSESLEAELERPVVRSLLHLLRWRTSESALFDGAFTVGETAPERLVMRWEREGRSAELRVDLADRTYEVDVDGVVVTSVDDLRIGEVGRRPVRPRAAAGAALVVHLVDTVEGGSNGCGARNSSRTCTCSYSPP